MKNKKGKNTIKNMLSILKKKKIEYINEFPYTRKIQWQDTLPKWRTDSKNYPNYDIPLDLRQGCYIVQDKKTKTVYNWFTHNVLSEGLATKRDYDWMEKETMPHLKSNEENLDYKILGWDNAYCKESWIGHEYFCVPGDQFLKFFEEKNSYYYYQDPIYEHEWNEDDLDEMREDYHAKFFEYWDKRNLTSENLGVV